MRATFLDWPGRWATALSRRGVVVTLGAGLGGMILLVLAAIVFGYMLNPLMSAFNGAICSQVTSSTCHTPAGPPEIVQIPLALVGLTVSVAAGIATVGAVAALVPPRGSAREAERIVQAGKEAYTSVALDRAWYDSWSSRVVAWRDAAHFAWHAPIASYLTAAWLLTVVGTLGDILYEKLESVGWKFVALESGNFFVFWLCVVAIVACAVLSGFALHRGILQGRTARGDGPAAESMMRALETDLLEAVRNARQTTAGPLAPMPKKELQAPGAKMRRFV